MRVASCSLCVCSCSRYLKFLENQRERMTMEMKEEMGRKRTTTQQPGQTRRLDRSPRQTATDLFGVEKLSSVRCSTKMLLLPRAVHRAARLSGIQTRNATSLGLGLQRVGASKPPTKYGGVYTVTLIPVSLPNGYQCPSI